MQSLESGQHASPKVEQTVPVGQHVSRNGHEHTKLLAGQQGARSEYPPVKIVLGSSEFGLGIVVALAIIAKSRLSIS